MRCRGFLEGRIKKLGKIKSLVGHEHRGILCHLRRCDAMGRRPGQSISFDETLLNDMLEKTNENNGRN